MEGCRVHAQPFQLSCPDAAQKNSLCGRSAAHQTDSLLRLHALQLPCRYYTVSIKNIAVVGENSLEVVIHPAVEYAYAAASR